MIKLIDRSSVEEFEIENEETRVYIRKPGPDQEVTGQTVQIHPQMVPIPQSQGAPTTQSDGGIAGERLTPKEDANETDPTIHTITSPMVGTFYAAPSPDADPYVKSGDNVNESTVVCIVEAMKLMNEIEAEVKGVIVDILVENGQLVEFGQPLFSVKLDS